MTIHPTGTPALDYPVADRAYITNRAAHDALDAVQCLIRTAGSQPALLDIERRLQHYIATTTEPEATAWWRHFHPYPAEGYVPPWGTYGT